VIGQEFPERKVSYLNTIISTLRDDRKKHNKFVTAEFANFADKRKMKQRFQVVANYVNKKEKRQIGSFIFSGLFFLTICISYIFVIQPAYPVPLSEVSADGGKSISPEDSYIIKMKDGKYLLKYGAGETMIELREDIAQEMIQEGYKFSEE
jgi:hypothetical protein